MYVPTENKLNHDLKISLSSNFTGVIVWPSFSSSDKAFRQLVVISLSGVADPKLSIQAIFSCFLELFFLGNIH